MTPDQLNDILGKNNLDTIYKNTVPISECIGSVATGKTLAAIDWALKYAIANRKVVFFSDEIGFEEFLNRAKDIWTASTSLPDDDYNKCIRNIVFINKSYNKEEFKKIIDDYPEHTRYAIDMNQCTVVEKLELVEMCKNDADAILFTTQAKREGISDE